jgi:molecular chaperone HscB
MSAPADYFALFSLPRRYELEREALEAAYERLTLAHHPDFFAAAPEAERQEAERTAAALNEGYRTLSDDAARAAYLLGLLAGGRTLDTTALPPGFLQEMFVLQEEVEELAEDAAAEARKGELRIEANGRLETVRAERENLFARTAAGPDGAADAAALQAIQSNLNCERYLRRLLERLDGQRDDA